jgi:hypothetical protein
MDFNEFAETHDPDSWICESSELLPDTTVNVLHDAFDPVVEIAIARESKDGGVEVTA